MTNDQLPMTSDQPSMTAKTYTTIRLSSWNDYKSFVDDLSENWAYRGQSSANWVLNNAIERTDFIKLYKGIELEFLHDFQRGARNYLNREDLPEHTIEWLALMQHHGAPTRLLDFSRSPFIAAFFAFEQSTVRHHDHHIAVWAININYLKLRAIEELSTEFAEDLKINKNLINETLFEKIFYENNRHLVFPVQPFRMNRRYSLQQSIFISTGISAIPFMEQLLFIGDQIERAVVKIELSSSLQKEVLRDLQRMNLNRASLFPDLDGYAAALKLRYNSIKTPEELLQHAIRTLDDKHHKFLP